MNKLRAFCHCSNGMKKTFSSDKYHEYKCSHCNNRFKLYITNNNEVMEAEIGENRIAFKQTAKGLWQCDGFLVYCKNLYEGIAISEKTIKDINDMLNKING